MNIKMTKDKLVETLIQNKVRQLNESTDSELQDFMKKYNIKDVNVKELDLSKKGISDISMLKHFTKLEKLDLRKNRITTNSLLSLEKLYDLKELDLSYNSIESINNLKKLKNLQILNLNSCGITDFRDFKKLDSLYSLDIRNNSEVSTKIIALIPLHRLIFKA
jgi:Leucine-rich repeat (LRR) protein